jgi:formylglycine-generating enzyme required for sulfatase activity
MKPNHKGKKMKRMTHSMTRTFPIPIIFMICLVGMSAQAATTQERKQPQTFHDCQGCSEMVVIPAGSFPMGVKNSPYSTPGSALATIQSERNLHQVSVNQFAIGKTEVTQGQWRAVMGNNPSYFNKCGDSCPVEKVSWDDAQLFIQKLNAITGKQYRLPSESEWEYACRAGKDDEDFCGSDVVGDVAWFSRNSSGSTHPASVLHANAWGLYDMSGNVMEWVEDSWHKSFSGAPVDGSAWQGDGAYRVVRGGASNDSAKNVKSYSRNYYGVGSRNSSIGFRLATSDVSSVSSDKPLPKVVSTETAKTGEKSSATDRLKELETMRAQGLITDSEYQQKRKQILDNF